MAQKTQPKTLLQHILFMPSFLTCFLLVSVAAFSQDSTNTFFKKIKKEIAPAGRIFYAVPYKVKSVTVIDNRPDTTRIGLFEDWLERDASFYLHYGETLQDIFTSLLTDGSGTTNLKIVLNHFFITNPELKSPFTPGGWGHQFPCMITIQAKVYIQQGAFWQGLFKADTAITIRQILERNFTDLIYETGLYFSRQIKQAVESQSFVHHPKLTDGLIDSINRPVAPVILQQQDSVGYFKTFADFMAGKLTPANISLERLQKGIYAAYLITPGEGTTFLGNIWGVVKNGEIYILRQRMAYPLIKEGNCYYWMEMYRYKNNGMWIPAAEPIGGSALMASTIGITDDIKLVLKPCMLNMQTGGGN